MELTEEENEALIDFEREVEDGRLLKSDIILSLDTGIIMLDLIKKQQKEIKENQVLIDDIKEHRIVYVDTPEFEEKFITKDKIREKIKKAKEINWHTPKLVIEYFKELLEEN